MHTLKFDILLISEEEVNQSC